MRVVRLYGVLVHLVAQFLLADHYLGDVFDRDDHAMGIKETHLKLEVD